LVSKEIVRMDSVSSDEVYQDQILPYVSRTFALTIPELPAELRTSVTCAYLLCRIADTIEDEPALSPPETLDFLQRFSAVLANRARPGEQHAASHPGHGGAACPAARRD
jgi:farnesyl-diphosphate farnesyltransferase